MSRTHPNRLDNARRAKTMAAIAVLTLAFGLFGVGVATAVPSGSAAAAASLELCNGAEELSGDDRDRQLERGMALAEQAVEADDRDALAHFATVCNLGKQMEASGLGFTQFLRLRRLRREMDRTVELAPTDADALAAKGVLLLKLPRWFGGDPKQAEELFRRALVSEPDNSTALCYLAQALTARGADGEARSLVLPPHC